MPFAVMTAAGQVYKQTVEFVHFKAALSAQIGIVVPR